MIELASIFGLICIVSHLPANYNQEIQNAHDGIKIDSIDQVTEELLARREQMITQGICKDNIILDPGIGFGKTKNLNWKLLEFAKEISDSNVMVGYSRKRFLGSTRLEPETNLHAAEIAIASGAKYLRVHDVAEHRKLIDSL